MITNKGNDIIAKYMLGQAPEYAAYIAVGVGAKPLGPSESDTSPQSKKSMDFEAFRVPVTSKGIVNDTITKAVSRIVTNAGTSTFTTTTSHGINVGDDVEVIVGSASPITVTVTTATSNTFVGLTSYPTGTVNPLIATVSYVKDRLIFKGQLPPDHKYQMTEIALYPATNNQLALGHDSRVLASFSVSEPWSIFGDSVPIEYESGSISDVNGAIVAFPNRAKFIDIDNISFQASVNRKGRYEQPRFLDRCLIVAGNMTTFSSDAMTTITSGSYLSNTSLTLDLSKYSSNDIVKVALSIVSQEEVPSLVPHKTRIRIDFVDVDNKIASFKKVILSSDISASRYIVVSDTVSNLDTPDTTFNWTKIAAINVYAETLNSSNSWDSSYVILDGMRIDNENTTNPLYGMVSYSKLRNSISNNLPIEKIENSQGYIEYRLGVSIF